MTLACTQNACFASRQRCYHDSLSALLIAVLGLAVPLAMVLVMLLAMLLAMVMIAMAW